MKTNNGSYEPPYSVEKIKNRYPEKAERLLVDPVHLWRANSGIELVHKEPTLQEQERIWSNWKLMNDTQKETSNKKSIEFFGLNNEEHQKKIIEECS
jgi:hypothetical protein